MRKRQKLSSVNQLQGKDSPLGLIVPAPVLKALGWLALIPRPAYLQVMENTGTHKGTLGLQTHTCRQCM